MEAFMGYSCRNIPGCSSSGSCSRKWYFITILGDSQQTLPIRSKEELRVLVSRWWETSSQEEDTHRVLVLKSRDRALIRKRSGLLLQLSWWEFKYFFQLSYLKNTSLMEQFFEYVVFNDICGFNF